MISDATRVDGASIMSYSRSQYDSLAELDLDVDAVRQVRYLLCTQVVSLRSRLRQNDNNDLLDPLRQSLGDLHLIIEESKGEISRAEVALWRLRLRSDDGDCVSNANSRHSIAQEPVPRL